MRRSFIVGVIVAALAVAQTFEVASIKPDTSARTGSHSSSDGLQWHIDSSLKGLVELAFEIQDFQFSGPEWMGYARFDVAAKMPTQTTRGARPMMLRNLLEERFGLKVHYITREVTGFALVVAKGGAKLKNAASEHGTSVNTTRGHLTATGAPIEDLAKTFATELKRPVTDETKLGGRYDLTLDWTPDEPKTDAETDSAGSIFTALQDQLGLKLETRKVPVDIIVVDSIERAPTEN